MSTAGENRRTTTQPKNGCILCDLTTNDEMHCGKLMLDPVSGVRIHQFCAYFCTFLPQNGDISSPLSGFEVPDILKAKKRNEGRRCVICGQRRATVSCHICSKFYHYGCARKSCLGFEYYKMFRMYCLPHIPDQMICLHNPGEGEKCPLCFEEVKYDTLGRNYIKPSCCNSVFIHRDCVQKMALEAGAYHFSCPVCRCKTAFGNEMRKKGIFTPFRDSSWNTQEDYDWLTARSSVCSAKVCGCKLGRSFQNDDQWTMEHCVVCGSDAVHRRCISEALFFCDKCESHRDLMTNKRFLKAALGDEGAAVAQDGAPEEKRLSQAELDSRDEQPHTSRYFSHLRSGRHAPPAAAPRAQPPQPPPLPQPPLLSREAACRTVTIRLPANLLKKRVQPANQSLTTGQADRANGPASSINGVHGAYGFVALPTETRQNGAGLGGDIANPPALKEPKRNIFDNMSSALRKPPVTDSKVLVKLRIVNRSLDDMPGPSGVSGACAPSMQNDDVVDSPASKLPKVDEGRDDQRAKRK